MNAAPDHNSDGARMSWVTKGNATAGLLASQTCYPSERLRQQMQIRIRKSAALAYSRPTTRASCGSGDWYGITNIAKMS